uniref:Uncharacterized protein n=1 Tax=Rhizophora mucronata TaxID=61149 RepID=A0A2P2R0E2_RHIMU
MIGRANNFPEPMLKNPNRYAWKKKNWGSD